MAYKIEKNRNTRCQRENMCIYMDMCTCMGCCGSNFKMLPDLPSYGNSSP